MKARANRFKQSGFKRFEFDTLEQNQIKPNRPVANCYIQRSTIVQHLEYMNFVKWISNLANKEVEVLCIKPLPLTTIELQIHFPFLIPKRCLSL